MMPLNKKTSKLLYFIFSLIIFTSLCVIPTIGLMIKKEHFQCEDCSFFYNFIASIIALILWSAFYGIFYLSLFSKDVRQEKNELKPILPIKLYLKYLQSSRGKKIQSYGLILPIAVMGFFILKLFFYQLFALIN